MDYTPYSSVRPTGKDIFHDLVINKAYNPRLDGVPPSSSLLPPYNPRTYCTHEEAEAVEDEDGVTWFSFKPASVSVVREMSAVAKQLTTLHDHGKFIEIPVTDKPITPG